MLVEAILSFHSETFFLPARRIFTKFMRISGGFLLFQIEGKMAVATDILQLHDMLVSSVLLSSDAAATNALSTACSVDRFAEYTSSLLKVGVQNFLFVPS